MSLSTDSREHQDIVEQPNWINPPVEAASIAPYVDAIRGGWWIIVAAIVGCVGANLIALSQTQKVYEASAFVVVSPVADRDGTFAGLGILRESNDPARNLETISTVIATPAVARVVRQRLKITESPRSLLEGVTAVPVAGSDLVSITVRAPTPASAQRLANAFAAATIEYRTTKLHSQVDQLIAGLRPLVATRDGERRSATQQTVAVRLAQLEALRVGSDPSVRIEAPAELPRTPAAPKPVLSSVVSLIAGILVGLGAVFGLQLLDPRLRSERQLRDLYRLPIMARVPKLKRTLLRFRAPTAPTVLNSYQALRASLVSSASKSGSDRSVMLTGPSTRDGKTTTSFGLARALAQSGQRTTLVEADARRPSVGSMLGVSNAKGLLGVMSGSATLSDALLQPDGEPIELQVLLAEESGDWLQDFLNSETADRLLADLEVRSDWVVIDSPPLGQVIDSLPFAMLTGQVLLVVRLGNSRLRELRRLTETLAQHGIRPTGFVVVGGSQPSYH